MIPKSVRGRIFVVLTFLNFGIAAFFAALGEAQQTLFSGVTATLCFFVWWAEIIRQDRTR